MFFLYITALLFPPALCFWDRSTLVYRILFGLRNRRVRQLGRLIQSWKDAACTGMALSHQIHKLIFLISIINQSSFYTELFSTHGLCLVLSVYIPRNKRYRSKATAKMDCSCTKSAWWQNNHTKKRFIKQLWYHKFSAQRYEDDLVSKF